MSVPVDLLVGRSWASGSIWLAPYVTAGVAMDCAMFRFGG